ncbi:I78 family peptidase inhibitor [Rhodobacteraceae bacterium KMM 6894]|nr:I78 family peptidase inhibitor [Rhodobacteraceae bacterium KMM 6894]
MKHITCAAALLTLAACQPEDATMKQPDTDSCGAATLSARIGTPAKDYDFANANRPHRIIPPNSAVTMDHRPDRLNVDLDEQGVITRLWCG